MKPNKVMHLQTKGVSMLQVGPEEARELLKKNIRNRNVSYVTVKRLANEMRMKKWADNGETIKISSDDILLDGQHRLHAIIESGETIPLTIVYGISDPNAFGTIDQGNRRGAHTLAQVRGLKNSRTATSIAKKLIQWDRTQEKSNFTLFDGGWGLITPAEVADYTELHDDEIQNMFQKINSSLPYIKCGAPSALVTSLILCKRSNEFAAEKFIDALKTGANLNIGSPIATLRDRLISPPDRKVGRKWEMELMALTIKSFNKYLHGKILNTLRWRQEGDFPEKFPVPGDRT